MVSHQSFQSLRLPPPTVSSHRLSFTVNHTLSALIEYAPHLRKEKEPQLLRKSTIIRCPVSHLTLKRHLLS